MLHVIFFPAEQPTDEDRLQAVLAVVLQEIPHIVHSNVDDLPPMQGEQLLFALPLGQFGINLSYTRALLTLRQHPHLLEGAVGGLVVDGDSQLYTKSAATELTLSANSAGCAFVGCPLVEGVATLENFHIQAGVGNTTLYDAYLAAVSSLVARLLSHRPQGHSHPKLLALHASTRTVSNSMDLWEGVRSRLDRSFQIQELCLRNGTLSDCSGCPYTTCLHFGEQGGCFYGGVMSEAVYPAVRQADGILLVCPNYNDALSANLTAFVNRLTALFRQIRFYDKAVFAIVVSGYSGSDVVARQIISAMNMNKSFYLPPHFALIQRAHTPGEALQQPQIHQIMDGYAANLTAVLHR